MTTMIWTHGEKGGPGKSTCALALTEVLSSLGKSYIVIEADTSNPDVGRRKLAGSPVIHYLDLSLPRTWADFSRIAEDAVKEDIDYILVNLPSQCMQYCAAEGGVFIDALGEIGVRQVGLFVINRQRDSLELAKQVFADPFGSNFDSWHLVRNLHYGKPEDFQLLAKSEFKAFPTVDLPALDDWIADRLFNDYAGPIKAVAEQRDEIFALHERSKIRTWLINVSANFGPLLAAAA